MFNKFQTLINTLLSEDNTAGIGGAFGTPDPTNNIVTTGDIKTSMAVALPNKKSKLSKKRQKGRDIIRRMNNMSAKTAKSMF